ncbi:hypothetical protein CHS0354_018071, partial [Potamilus streckersoni]
STIPVSDIGMLHLRAEPFTLSKGTCKEAFLTQRDLPQESCRLLIDLKQVRLSSELVIALTPTSTSPPVIHQKHYVTSLTTSQLNPHRKIDFAPPKRKWCYQKHTQHVFCAKDNGNLE